MKVRLELPRWRAACSVVSALSLGASPLNAQSDAGFRMPVELFQGLTFEPAGAVTPYQASIAVLPSYSFDPLRLGVKLGLDYDNPSWRARIGPRLSSRILPVLRGDIGVLLGAEATTTTRGDVRYAGNLTFDVDGMVRLGVLGGWEEAHGGSWFLGLTLGTDPTRLFSCVRDDFTGECIGTGDANDPSPTEPQGGRR